MRGAFGSGVTVILDGAVILDPEFTGGRRPRWPGFVPPPPPVSNPDWPGPVAPPRLTATCRGEPMALPPFLESAWFTQACFEQASLASRNDTWPATTCVPPCLRPRSCELPSAESVERAKQTFQIIIPPEHFLEDPSRDSASWPAPVRGTERLDEALVLTEPMARLLAGDVSPMYDLIYSAWALILDNIDIVEWVICLVDQWSALAPTGSGGGPDWVPGNDAIPSQEHAPYNSGEILPCMLDGLSGAHAVYMFQDFGLDRSGAREGATGGATEPDVPGQFFSERVVTAGLPFGVTVPIGNNYLRRLARAHQVGGRRGLCATMVMAEILLHEMMHICVRGEREPSDCWQPQHMVANSFQWAMGERYSCLQNYGCCPRVSPYFFMNSEPRFDVFQGYYLGTVSDDQSAVLEFQPVFEPAVRNPAPYAC